MRIVWFLMRIVWFLMLWIAVSVNAASALDYPGLAPGQSHGSRSASGLLLSNRSLAASWNVEAGRVTVVTVTNLQTGHTLQFDSGHMPHIVVDEGRVIDLSRLKPTTPLALQTLEADASLVRKEAAHGGRCITATFQDPTSGIRADWSVQLRDESNYVIESLDLTSDRAVRIRELVFADATVRDARTVGEVDGSVVLSGDIFLAVEHPLAVNKVGAASRVRCALPRGNVLQPGQTCRYTFVIGVVPPNQLRRGFLYYLERRRAHPYRPFLHYNSWYHLNIGRPNNHMTEAECLATIEHIGREMVCTRGVKLDAFVWDDGWDDFDSLWGFHRDFPDGFKRLKAAAEEYGAAQGVWMSPWGGYGGPKEKRIAYGKSQGYETNRSGFSMAGAKYGKAFRDVCLRMMRENGVVFFKFDGMGSGNSTGATGEMGDDVDAVLVLTQALRRENPDLFISATTGTWASPFWVCYADSIWRQGGDTGFHGAGNGRRRWITYRDMFCYRRIVQMGPLYPLNSLMLHGPCIGERGDPARMTRDEESVAEEIWTFFGSGTNLQELYISPHLLTKKMWDELAAAAKWSRANADVLVDAHWVGGDPGNGEVYGWASWQLRKGIVVLRNPSDKPQSYALELAHDLELPDEHLTDYELKPSRKNQRLGTLRAVSVEPLDIQLQPFEVLVFEATAVPSGRKYDAKAQDAAALVFGASAAQGAEVLVEAEGFADCGGWVVDQQFMDIMGSPYLLAHGLGRPVAPARTEVEFPETGTYRLWVRTKDWVPAHSPGRFRVRLDGREVPVDFGTQGEGWLWQDGGQVEVGKKRVAIELVDLTGFDGRCDALLFTADQAFVPPREPDEAMATWRRRLLGLPETPPSAGRFDLVVVGGGIAGCSSAIAAARLGCTVALIQDRPVYGGNNSPEIRVHTGGQAGPIVSEINGGYDHKPGDPKWLEEPSPPTRAAERRQAVLDAEKNLRQFLGWHAFRVQKTGSRIESVDAKDIDTNRELRFAAPVFIDATGDGSVGFWAGAECRVGREAADEHNESLAPEKADRMTLGTSLCWGSRDAGRPVPFPEVPWATEVSKDSAATSGDWTWEYGHWRDTIRDAEEIRDHLLRAIYGSFATAKRRDPAKYANYELLWVPYVGGKRESRRLIGDYILTQNDIQATRPFPDGVATGSWSIDLHYPKDYEKYPFRTYAQFNKVKPYPIPFRCLYSRNVENLMMAGRCISVTHVALGSTRVMNTCGQTGVATGAAAYLCKKHAALPRGIYQEHLEELLDIVHGRGTAAGTLEPKKAEPAAP